MKTAVLCGIAFSSAAAAFAQLPATPPQTTTLSGCVTGGTKARPIALVNALVLPAGAATTTPAATASSVPVETAAATPRAVGTVGTVRGTAPAGSSSSSVGGYRLSGTDMTSWIGRRVQIIGTLVSSPTASSDAPVGTSGTQGTVAALPMPEFHVISVQPITGVCPAR